MKEAKFDHQHCDKEYAKLCMKNVEEKYAKLFEEAANNPEELAKLKKKYKDDLHIAKHTKLVTNIQMIFQDSIAALNPRMTVREIISEGLVINGIKDKEYIDEKVYEILELVGLVREHAGRYPHEFSGGQRQRIGIARSVIMNPDLLIADEPISALDVSIQAQIINLMNELRERLGLTILFIAHDLSVVKYFSDRIGVMYYGNMVELAETDELFRHPLHPYTRSLLSAIPLPDPHAEKKRTRIVYNALAEHDYSVDKPSMREILPGHFVYCNDAEEQKYKKELGL
ncbi:MAG: ATP-binding cassette domain-containing protein [Oscillospiraceae bacterium]|nr:ATP-binding cassette domain-containing protein [Oscillospiraceae bacterium]